MITMSCALFTDASEEIANAMADAIRTIITDDEIEADVEYEETIFVECTEDVTSPEQVCELAKTIARASSDCAFKVEGKIDEFGEMEQKFKIEFDGKKLVVSFTPRYMFVPQDSEYDYNDFCRYFTYIDEWDFEKLAYQDLYLVDGLNPVDKVEFETPILLEF